MSGVSLPLEKTFRNIFKCKANLFMFTRLNKYKHETLEM